MGSERKRHSNVTLNLTPLIDIVFLLLVFFMLTAHFIEEQSIDIALPKANSSDASLEDAYVDVTLTPGGELLVEGKPTTPEELTDVLKGALHAPNKRYVRLRGDQAAEFGKAVNIIDAARIAGAESVDILTEQP
jgi:biopolymer transport protein ExbD